MRKLLAACAAALLVPYLTTLALAGPDGMERGKAVQTAGRAIILDRGEGLASVDLEEYLVGLLAVQIPAEYEMEALKAQAVAARTAVLRQMGKERSIAESALDMDILEPEQMEATWGRETFQTAYPRLRQAVRETAGQALFWNGDYIEPLFHRLSAGKTRQGDASHPYLQSVDAPKDREGDGYLTTQILSRAEVASRLNSMADSPGLLPDEVPQRLQVVEKDSAGYVKEFQAGSRIYSGDEIRYALALPSPAFWLEEDGDAIRISACGIGHGYGLDQYGANEKAKDGWTAAEILEFYYKNTELIAE